MSLKPVWCNQAASGGSEGVGAREALLSLDPDVNRDAWVQVVMAARSASLSFGCVGLWRAAKQAHIGIRRLMEGGV